jgi:hypothetical protein
VASAKLSDSPLYRNARPSLRERAAALAARVVRSEPATPPKPQPALNPDPGSEEAKAAFKRACHEHTIRTQFANEYPELKRTPLEWWTAHSLSKALETGELTPAECARLYPLATERELRMAEIEHALNIRGLFALAFADGYPVVLNESYEGAEAIIVTPDAAPLSEPETPPVTAPPATDSLVGMLGLTSASMNELQTIRDVAERVGSVAYVHAWGPRCRNGANAYGAPHFNAAGKLVQWVGDALTAVESAAEEEARRRTPESRDDREGRLSMLAVTTIDNGDPDETEAFARELLAHVEADRAAR